MKFLTKNKHWDIVEDYNCDKLLYLLVDRPDKISTTAYYFFKQKNQWYRNYDLPVILYGDGEIAWYDHGKSKRKNNRPVRIYADGYKQYDMLK